MVVANASENVAFCKDAQGNLEESFDFVCGPLKLRDGIDAMAEPTYIPSSGSCWDAG